MTLLLGQVRPQGMPAIAQLTEGSRAGPGVAAELVDAYGNPTLLPSAPLASRHEVRGPAGLDERPERDLGLHDRRRPVDTPLPRGRGGWPESGTLWGPRPGRSEPLEHASTAPSSTPSSGPREHSVRRGGRRVRGRLTAVRRARHRPGAPGARGGGRQLLLLITDYRSLFVHPDNHQFILRGARDGLAIGWRDLPNASSFGRRASRGPAS